ncbi:hypothetical protein DFH09DRAFT_119306 [Mycena vulgaris]|nr:hypothetical protein DFH09DRAFT_119306 [Mycena vulgaris]
MSSPPLTLSFKKTTTKATPAADGGDHRKRRRNRTTQSCLNCHTTKRMCDRKRPCSRCSQLGITGNCVYEVDDPSRQGKQDEGTRLINRIAELEGVVRELKNKPHPRWLAEQVRPPSGSPESRPSPPSSGGPSTPNGPGWAFPSSAPGFPFPPQASSRAPSYDSDTLDSLFSAYAGLTDHMHIRRGGSCGCLNEAACYNVVLELSLRLRKAADVLAKSPSHSMSSGCALHAQISELDALVKSVVTLSASSMLEADVSDRNTLLNAPSHSTGSSRLGFSPGPDKSAMPPAVFDQQYANDTSFAWDLDDFTVQNNDDLMSWIPTRGTM